MPKKKVKKNQISICIPTYKRNDYLFRAIKSILQQKLPKNWNVEIIISDNNPNNILPNKLKKLLKNERCIYSKNQANIGFERNLKKLLTLTKGEISLILTDDDVLLPGALRKIISIFERHDVVYLFSKLMLSRERKICGSENILIVHEKIIYPSDLHEIAKLFLKSYTLTGLCFKTEYLEIETFDDFIFTGAPQMKIIGDMLVKFPGYFLPSPLFVHEIGNEVHWCSDATYLLSKKFFIIDSLLTGDNFKKLLKKEHKMEIPYYFYIHILDLNSMYKLAKALLHEKIISIHDIPIFISGIVNLVRKKIS